MYGLERRHISEALNHVGLERGTTVCAHSSLGRLGHVVGGPDALIDALQDAVGQTGCLLMPTFPLRKSMAEVIDSSVVFDVTRTSSQNGIVTEVFRKRADVTRSLHPTNPVAAWGRSASALLQNHEHSPTPYGPTTPYGRLAEIDDGFVLMLETHVHSLLHHLQERVDFPNLFLDGLREIRYIDRYGAEQVMQTRVMRPRIPYFIAVPSARDDDPDWAILHDFGLMFPARRRREVRGLGYRFDGYPKLYQRRRELERLGVLRTSRLGRGEIGLLHVKSFLSTLEPELRELISRFRTFYDPEAIADRRLPYS